MKKENRKEIRKEINKKVKLAKDLIEEKEKNEIGITLIALIVTIIILLILAGVTIATLTGENGIITRANEANNIRGINNDFSNLEEFMSWLQTSSL